jgi:large subunit ribosomal protein L10
MIATKERKAEQVEALVGLLRRSPTIYLTDFTGLDVARLTELRRKLRAAGVEYVVVKNTLARRAFGEARVAGLDAHLEGPTGLVLAGTDPVAAARVLTDFAKEHTTLAVKVGLVEGKAIAPDQVTRLAHLPSKAELLGQLGGAFQAPLAGLLGAMNGLLTMMVGALEALKDQRASSAAS